MRRIIERLVDEEELLRTDYRILTPQEHLLIGSNLPVEYGLYPRKPVALTNDDLTYEEVQSARVAKRRIVSASAWALYDVEFTEETRRHAMVFELAPVDPNTRQVEKEFPVLVGIYDFRRRSISYIPDELNKYVLTAEARRRLSFEGVRGSLERMGS